MLILIGTVPTAFTLNRALPEGAVARFSVNSAAASKIVGIVSRANLIQALASVVGRMDQHDETDRQMRLELMSRLWQQSWTILAAATLRSAAALCICGGWSARRRNTRPCSRWRKACPEYLGLPTK